tara:strand:+ start:218 stop:625 length:408 start_codon:yes stop_codon:yes gene_type:complete
MLNTSLIALSLFDMFDDPSIFKFKPSIKNIRIVIVKVGIVVIVIYLMCVNKSAPDIAGARFVVSLSGDNLSPKYAPDKTAPAVIPFGIFRAPPININAIPTVAVVVQLLPVEIDTTAQQMSDAKRKKVGFRICNP